MHESSLALASARGSARPDNLDVTVTRDTDGLVRLRYTDNKGYIGSVLIDPRFWSFVDNRLIRRQYPHEQFRIPDEYHDLLTMLYL